MNAGNPRLNAIDRVIEQLSIPSRNKAYIYYQTEQGRRDLRNLKLLRSLAKDLLVLEETVLLEIDSRDDAGVVCRLHNESLRYKHELHLSVELMRLIEKVPELSEIFSKKL